MFTVADPIIHSTDYNENIQTINIKFAFANISFEHEIITPLYTPAKCREYFADALLANTTKKPSRIYGFHFDPSIQKIDTKKVVLLVTYPNRELYERTKNNMHIMNDYEFSLGFNPTKIYDVGENEIPKSKLVFIGDKKWQSKLCAIQYYSFLIKCMAYNLKEGMDWRKSIINGEHSSNEQRLLKSIEDELSYEDMDNIFSLILKNKGNISGYIDDNTISSDTCHSSTGIFSILTNNTYGKNRFVEIMLDYKKDKKNEMSSVRRDSDGQGGNKKDGIGALPGTM